MISAQDALALLKDGNLRFVSEDRNRDAITGRMRRLELAKSQEPFAAILGCSDSRVPVEIVFDQGLGDLFVIRVAGNIVAPSLIGSVEFAAEQFMQMVVSIPQRRALGIGVPMTPPELEKWAEDTVNLFLSGLKP